MIHSSNILGRLSRALKISAPEPGDDRIKLLNAGFLQIPQRGVSNTLPAGTGQVLPLTSLTHDSFFVTVTDSRTNLGNQISDMVVVGPGLWEFVLLLSVIAVQTGPMQRVASIRGGLIDNTGIIIATNDIMQHYAGTGVTSTAEYLTATYTIAIEFGHTLSLLVNGPGAGSQTVAQATIFGNKLL